MPHVFRRRLAIPLWALVFVAVALTAPPPGTLPMPPTTLIVMAVVGIAAMVFTMAGALTWLRTTRSLVRVLPSPRAPLAPGGVEAGGTWRAGGCGQRWNAAEYRYPPIERLEGTP